jgi:pseudouridine synthase
LLTNDGQLTQSLEHPSAQVPKTYLVTLSHPWDPRVTATVLRPREISSYGDDGVTDILQLDTLEQLDEKTLRITIHSGAKRHIRRVLRSVDYYINTLQRISMGPYKLANLAPGDIQQLDIISID